MKTNPSPSPRPTEHPPLAHDAKGNAQPVPEGTAFWLLKRETGGRPKIIVGADRQPVRFALTTTVEDLEAMLGDGTFRVHALNDVGEMIDYVCTFIVGDEDDRSDDEAQPRQLTSWPVANNNTDSLHHALNTITAMAKAQAEALCQVSEAQADFLKGLASAKALPRNAWSSVLPPKPPWIAPAAEIKSDDEEDEGEEEEDEPPDKWAELGMMLGPLVPICADILKSKVPGRRNTAPELPAATPEPVAPPAAPAPAPAAGPSPLIHLAQIQAQLPPDELRFLAHLLSGPNAEKYSGALLASSVEEAVTDIGALLRERRERKAAKAQQRHVSVQEESAAPVSTAEPTPVPVNVATDGAHDFMSHVYAVRAHLKPKELAAAMALMPRLRVERAEALKIQLLRMSPKDAATWIKANLESLQAEVES